MTVVVAIIGMVATLLGVGIGAWSTGNRSERDWLRERRAGYYLELLDLMIEISETFAVGLRVSKLQTASAQAAGHDFQAVDDAWRDQLDQLEHVELRISLLGGKLDEEYRRRAGRWISNMLEIVDASAPTESKWNDIANEGWALRDTLVMVAKGDLVPTKRLKIRR